MRDVNDPRVATIVKALDRSAASPHSAMLRITASVIATQHGTAERFDGWENDAIRDIVIALALRAPDDELADMVESAEAADEWCVFYDSEGHVEDSDCPECGAKHVEVTP